MRTGLAASTVTPGVGSPPLSRTTPAIPDACCAAALVASNTTQKRARRRGLHRSRALLITSATSVLIAHVGGLLSGLTLSSALPGVKRPNVEKSPGALRDPTRC